MWYAREIMLKLILVVPVYLFSLSAAVAVAEPIVIAETLEVINTAENDLRSYGEKILIRDYTLFVGHAGESRERGAGVSYLEWRAALSTQPERYPERRGIWDERQYPVATSRRLGTTDTEHPSRTGLCIFVQPTRRTLPGGPDRRFNLELLRCQHIPCGVQRP